MVGEILFRFTGSRPELIPLVRQAGIRHAVTAGGAEFDAACRAAGLNPLPASTFAYVSWAELRGDFGGRIPVLTEGNWPGISRGGNRSGPDDETASASRQPWVDANSYWAGCLRALAPGRPALLGYLPDEKAGVTPERVIPYDTLELALVDAWAGGGNYLLSLEARFERDLLAKNPQALQAWRSLGRTCAWLRENQTLFGRPAIPIVTALVEPGAESAELVNLMYRQNVSPALAPAWAPPPPDPERIRALVACGIRPPAPPQRDAILAHAGRGATVVVDTGDEPPWWRVSGLKLVRDEDDREQFTLGRGRVYGYKTRILDPSEFAFDVIDFVHHRNRAVRIWNAPAVIALAAGSGAGRASVCLVNYGSPAGAEFPARVQGVFQSAVLLRPESAPLELKAVKRGTTTEIQVPELRRLGVVEFS
jgi:hypothetical protein